MTKKQQINNNVKSGKITQACFDCADKYRIKEPYAGTCTVHEGICQICNEKQSVTSATKLFGYHKFL